MRNDHLRSNTRQPRSFHRGDARSGVWALAVLATFGASTALSGCVSDPDCGVCDPENLILETVAGVNYAGKVVKLLGPECEGDSCPGEITRGNYFVEKVYPCVESDDALKSPRGVDEWCRVSPLIVNDGLQFIFNNLLDAQSVELVRKSPVNPQLFEVYDWKTRIVSLEGPITRYNGDYFRAGSQTQPDRLTRLVNLSCVDNLAAQGMPFNHTAPADICDGTRVVDGKTLPMKMELDRPINAAKGEVDSRRVSQSCTTPQDGVDTCCDACDYELSVNVAKYGLKSGVQLDELTPASFEQKASPNDGSAIKCDPMVDKFAQCAAFVPHVYRGDEVRNFSYTWLEQGKEITSRIPLQDKIRETHPANRPFGANLPGNPQRTVPCETREDCAADPGPNLPGMDCVGRVANSSQVCSDPADPNCQFRCEAEWFVECRADADTTGSQGYCVDKRWSGQGVAACFTTQSDYPICLDGECTATNASDGANRRFAYADADGDNLVSAIEACRGALSDGQVGDQSACDPYFQSKVRPNPRYDRKETLPSTTRNCVCTDDPADGCEDIVNRLCHVDGDPAKPLIEEKKGEYALKFVSRNGGVIYDPAVKGVLFLPADLGAMPRSFVEGCSAGRAKGAGALNIKDGWRGNDSGFFENFENFDRAMCSSSTYKIKFEPQPENEGKLDAIQYIRDKVGNYLAGKATYIIKTPDFHVVPGSGFPTDNLRIGACDDFELRFSNKYDMSPQNVAKLEIVELGGTDTAPVEGNVVAGGQNCAPDKVTFEGGGKVPCLTINVRDQEIGSIRVEIDSKEFGAVLKPGKRYRLRVPSLALNPGEAVSDAMARDPAGYKAAFWDACGMPLVTTMPRLDDKGVVVKSGGSVKTADFLYDFSIDTPKCKEDLDLDGYQFSCDNAPKDFNDDQRDSDADGFGDVIDKCVSVATDNNSADSDRDYIGNDCDVCQRAPSNYNKNAGSAPAYMLVRNIPDQSDYDGDGIGDVCDNCITVSNCGDWGNDDPGKKPAKIGDPVPFENTNICQVDNDMTPFVGDACVGAPMLPEAAGPIGVGPQDDFDQDGIINADDGCPRQRLKACTTDDECGTGIACTDGKCANHYDFDNDGVGDACDTCPYVANPKQIQEGSMQEDDEDGDFVGFPCETNAECYDRADARPIAFYTKIAPSGMCCTTVFKEGVLDAPRLRPDGEPLEFDEIDALMAEYRDALAEFAMTGMGEAPKSPLFVPLSADCQGQTPDKCRELTPAVKERPGIIKLPDGCSEAGVALTLDSPQINNNADELYKFTCMLPQVDQDFDGIGDACDLCPYAFDKDNSLYKDQNNKVWPSNGKYCKGPWDPEVAPRLESQCGSLSEDMGGTDTGGDTDTGGGGTTGG